MARPRGPPPAPSPARAASSKLGEATDEASIPVIEERLRVGKRETGHGRVRIRSYVVETPVQEQVTLRQEHVQVERRPVDRPLTGAEAAFGERTIEATERSEEAVVAKEARVKEEVSLRKTAEDRTETVRDTVRRTEVEVEDDRKAGAARTATPAGKERARDI
ncbi:YsnF/AvaK domain-containing protein [Dankookia sp. P2]|uniref:YsnF/AvaK domain-containing protein n=1 Tax=Dankookia sp. P2 TaxID=3423955 RepID=UPI003D679D0E